MELFFNLIMDGFIFYIFRRFLFKLFWGRLRINMYIYLKILFFMCLIFLDFSISDYFFCIFFVVKIKNVNIIKIYSILNYFLLRYC